MRSHRPAGAIEHASRPVLLFHDTEVPTMYELMGYAHSRLSDAARRLERAGGRTAARMSGEGGQGTVEYVALILLVALIMAGVVVGMKNFKTNEGEALSKVILTKIKSAVEKVQF
jgi:hypothetical protein